MERILLLAVEDYSFKGDNGSVDLRRISYTDGIPQKTDRGVGCIVQHNESSNADVLRGVQTVPGVYDVVWSHTSTKAGVVRKVGALSFVGGIDLESAISGAQRVSK